MNCWCSPFCRHDNDQEHNNEANISTAHSFSISNMLDGWQNGCWLKYLLSLPQSLHQPAPTGLSGPEASECWVTKRSVGAVTAANTRVDHHHGPPYQCIRQAAEGHLSSAGLMRYTAGGAAALAAVAQPVSVSTDAALVNQPNGAWRCVAGPTLPLLPCLDVHKHTHVRRTRKRNGRGQRSKCATANERTVMKTSAHFGGWVNWVARPHFAKSRFHLQLAGGVLVGNPCGDPGATALRTGAPLGALRRTGGGRWD